jgi:hypothetical protein
MFFLIFTENLFSQQVPMKVISETSFFDSVDRHVGDLRVGEIISVGTFGSYHTMSGNEPTFNIFFYKEGDDNGYGTYVENVVPLNTESFFTDDVLTTNEGFRVSDGDNYFGKPWLLKEMWLPLYYLDVLQSKDRESLLKYEPYLNPKNWKYEDRGLSSDWYVSMYFGLDNVMMIFFNGMIYTAEGEKNFLVKNIIKTNYGYEVSCYGPLIESYGSYWDEMIKRYPGFKWELYIEGAVTLFLYIDGEYMDIYMDQVDAEHKFGTVIRAKEEFIRQLQLLLETNTCDLTNVIWPRRADKQIETGKTYRTAEVLRLRTSEDRNSELIMEMPVNTVVHVLETGTKGSIDNITASWVKVRLGNGTEGWCFGGYLLADVPVSVSASKDSDLLEGNTAQEAVVTESPPQTPAFPFMFLIVVVGGAVILAAVVVFLIRRKRSVN